MSVSDVVSAGPARQAGGELGALLEQLDAVTDAARKVFGGLSAAQLNWKPAPERWSVGQCFDHLITTNRTFFADIEKVAAGTHRASLWGRVSPLSGFFGRLVLKSLDPEKGRKTKAPRVFEPSSSDVAPDVIERFAAHQDELAERMRSTANVDLARTIVTSPVAAVATYSLLDAYRIVVAHERKHFEQARSVTGAEGFPAA
ncbi:MAG TPA: DinB family protein [Pyrinomonadaceae bacterium]|nr:DinB family protein [Pyrinomonadaceae bacterium]